MTMKSLSLLPELEKIPKAEGSLRADEFLPRIRAMDRDQFAIEVAITTEETLEGLFHWRNVDDDLTEGYNEAFSRIAEEGTSLTERFSEKVAEGPQAVEGFVNNIKGKIAEIKSEELLEERFPGYDFELADSANQPGWDLVGTSPDGEDIFVQIKTGSADYAGGVVDAMEESPNTAFAVSSEVFGAIQESHPELASRLVDIGANTELTEDVRNGLEKLAANHGVDLPDSIGEMLPYVGEVVIGLRLIRSIAGTERELADVELTDRSRVHGIRTLALIARFGINTVSALVGGSGGGVAGSIIPGIGNIIGTIAGSIGGLFVGRQVHKALEPKIEELATELVGGDSEDLYYWMNKQEIDQLGQSFAVTQVA